MELTAAWDGADCAAFGFENGCGDHVGVCWPWVVAVKDSPNAIAAASDCLARLVHWPAQVLVIS